MEDRYVTSLQYILRPGMGHNMCTNYNINTFTTCCHKCYSRFSSLFFTDALFGLFSGQYWIHFFPVHCYFPGSIVTLREAKCDLMCLEAVVNLKLNWSDTAAVFILALIKARDSSRFNCLWIVRAVHVPPQLFKYLHLFKLAGNSWADSVTT